MGFWLSKFIKSIQSLRIYIYISIHICYHVIRTMTMWHRAQVSRFFSSHIPIVFTVAPSIKNEEQPITFWSTSKIHPATHHSTVRAACWNISDIANHLPASQPYPASIAADTGRHYPAKTLAQGVRTVYRMWSWNGQGISKGPPNVSLNCISSN